MAGFAYSVREFANKTKRSMRQTLKGIVLELATRMVMRSPVDLGPFRGNWMVGIGSPDTRADGAEDLQPFGSPPSQVTFADWLAALEVITFTKVIYITNNLPYARVIEYGEYGNPPGTANGPRTVNGFSKMAPAGVVRVTVLEYADIVAKVVEVNKV